METIESSAVAPEIISHNLLMTSGKFIIIKIDVKLRGRELEKKSISGVGVLDNVLYAVGGHDGPLVRKSVEAFNCITQTWTPIVDMNLCRRNAGNHRFFLVLLRFASLLTWIHFTLHCRCGRSQRFTLRGWRWRWCLQFGLGRSLQSQDWHVDVAALMYGNRSELCRRCRYWQTPMNCTDVPEIWKKSVDKSVDRSGCDRGRRIALSLQHWDIPMISLHEWMFGIPMSPPFNEELQEPCIILHNMPVRVCSYQTP